MRSAAAPRNVTFRVRDRIGRVLTFDRHPRGRGLDVVEAVGGRHDEGVGHGAEQDVGLHTVKRATGGDERRGVHIADEVVQGHGHDALTAGQTGQVLGRVLGQERSGHGHHRQGRHRGHVAADLLEHDGDLGPAETRATVGLGQGDAHDAEVGQFTPQVEVDAGTGLDLLETFHRASVGEHAGHEAAQLLLIGGE